MKSITTALLAIVATTLALKGVAAAALPEPQSMRPPIDLVEL